jgi:hypothetical protein
MKYYLFTIHTTVSTSFSNTHASFKVPKMYDNSTLLEDIKEDIENVASDLLEMCVDECPFLDIEGANAKVEKEEITRERYFDIMRNN